MSSDFLVIRYSPSLEIIALRKVLEKKREIEAMKKL